MSSALPAARSREAVTGGRHGVGAERATTFWSRWVLANAGGELAGLGTAALIGWILVASLRGEQSLTQHILLALAMIAAGAFEGAVVGAAQAWVLAPRLPALPRWEWLRATILGALVAWALGMLPSTLLAAGAETSGQPAAEPGPGVVYPLAALLGAVAGAILAFLQWRVLRRHLPGALGWLAANAAAWTLGMPIIFLGADVAAHGGSVAAVVSTVVLTLAGAGAVVGAVHGLWLVWKLPAAGEGRLPSASPTRVF